MDLRFTIYDLRLTFAAASECPPVSRTGRDRVSGESYGTSIEERTTSAMPAWFTPRASRFPSPRPSPLYVFSALVGMARCAVPARVVAGGTNIPAILAFQGVAPLHAARTSQRDVPTTLNTYPACSVAILFGNLIIHLTSKSASCIYIVITLHGRLIYNSAQNGV